MTRTQFTDARRNVRRQIVSWISIVVIGLVSLVAYLSLVYSSEAIKRAVSSYYDTYDLWDLEITSPLLLDEDILAAVRTVPGVERAEPVWMIGTKLADVDTETTVTVQTVPEAISVPELLSGRMPEAAGECAIEQQLQGKLGLDPGEEFEVENISSGETELLMVTSFVVTGIVRDADHISFEVPEAPYVLVTRDSFNLEGLSNAFMKIRVGVGGVPANRYSEAYGKAVAPVREAVEALMAEQMEARGERIRTGFADIVSEGEQKLEEGAAKLEEGAAKLDEATQQLSDGEAKLASARQQLDDGWAELKEAEKKLVSAKQQLDDGGRALADAEYQIAALEGLMYKAQGLIGAIDSRTGAQTEDYLPGSISEQLQSAIEGMHKYNDGRNLWYSSGEEYLDGLTLFEQGKKRLEQGEREYTEGLAEYEKGKAEYEKGLAEYEKGKADYDDGVIQLREAKQRLEEIGPARCLVLDASGNAGYVFAESQANGLSSMSYSFSLLFLAVAALVIYASVGRMVQEQRALIGTSKALGLYNREILGKYMFFGISAAITAAVLGVGLTYFAVQPMALANYEPFFVLDSIPPCFRPVETAVVVIILPLVAGLSVWFACRRLIRIPAIRLLQGEQPANRRKSTRHISSRGLYTRLIYRNIRSDLRRVLVTIISIAGCCQLLVGGFMLKHAIERVNARQFGQIVQFQAELYIDPSAADVEQFAQLLEDNGLSYVLVGRHDFIFRSGNTFNSATAIVAEPDSLAGFYGLKDSESKEEIRATDDGILIPIRLSQYRGLQPGDSLTALDTTLATHEVPISGVFTNHFGNQLFFTPACYKQVFGANAEQNCFLIRLDGMSLDELEARSENIPGFRQVKDAAADRVRLDKMSSVLNAMIFMLLGLAGVMAYFIVMNLSVTYIQQKTRELTIMRINGFTVRECVTYVSWDLVVTTVFGIALGLVAGHFLGQMVIPVTEGPYMYFVHDPDLRTYLYAALITAGFSAAISSAALRKVKNLKLSDIV